MTGYEFTLFITPGEHPGLTLSAVLEVYLRPNKQIISIICKAAF